MLTLPTASTQSESSWLREHASHPLYFVKRWDSVIALRGGAGDLWACDCKGDGDRHWYRI